MKMYDHYLANEAHFSDITLTNISASFTYKMAAKINRHRYGTKLRHCHPMYKQAGRRKKRDALLLFNTAKYRLVHSTRTELN